MRPINKNLFLAILFGVASLCPVSGKAAEPPQLDEFRQEFAINKKGVVVKGARRKVYISYIDKLRILESDLRLINGDIEGARQVRQEISAVREELAAPPKAEPVQEIPVEASSFVVKSNSVPSVVSELKAIPPLYDPLAEEEAAKKAAEKAAAEAERKIAEAEAAKKAAEEASQKAQKLTAAREVAAQKAAEEVAEKTAAEVAAQKAAEETVEKAAAEAAAQKTAEEVAGKVAAEATARKAAEEAANPAPMRATNSRRESSPILITSESLPLVGTY